MVRAAYLRFASFATQALSWCSLPATAFNRSGWLPHLVTRIVVAAVLLAAGTLKLWSLANEADFHSGWDYLTALLATGELLLGTLLLFRQPGMVAWRVCTLVFVVFACFSTYFTINGAPTCGCFGIFVVSPVWILALDLALLAAQVAFPPRLPGNDYSPIVFGVWAVRLASGLTFASLATVCVALSSAAFGPAEKRHAPGVIEKGDELVLTPSKWTGLPLPILDLLGEQGNYLRTGEWEIWIIDPACAKCRAVLEQRLQQSNVFRPQIRLAMITESRAHFTAEWLTSVLAIDAVMSLPANKRVVCDFPACIRCNNSIVRNSMHSSLTSVRD